MSRIRHNDARINAEYKIWTNSMTRAQGNILVGTLRSISDAPSSGWNQRSPGKVIIGGCDITTTVHEDSSVPVQVGPVVGPLGTVWGPQYYSGPYYSAVMLGTSEPSWVAGDLESAKQNCVVDAYNEAFASTSQNLVTIAEFEKTSAMLKSPLKMARQRVAQMFERRAQRVKRGEAASLATASTWLEYRMGWRPLVYDIMQTLSALEKSILNDDGRTFRVKKTFPRTWESSFDASRVGVPLHGDIPAVGHYKVDYRVGCQLFCRHTMRFDNPYRRLSNFGLTPGDVLPSVWELIPLSFVVDRFINVGNWLGAVQGSWDVEVLASYTFSKTERIRSWDIGASKMNIYLDGTNIPTSKPPARVSDSYKSYTRTTPAPVPNLPTWVPRSLTLQQHADHAALIAQALAAFSRRIKT